jgi:hypothetical protein
MTAQPACPIEFYGSSVYPPVEEAGLTIEQTDKAITAVFRRARVRSSFLRYRSGKARA